jgi:hypothetical protein
LSFRRRGESTLTNCARITGNRSDETLENGNL